tara:strand:- start:201 stop:1046 length:846 start_codon:yes stop_codon:yes gene_type:complete
MKSQKFNIMIVCIFSFLFTGNCYPPAPHHIIEGLVRNEQGVPIISDSIEVLAVSEDDKTVSTKVGDVYKPGVNYSIKIPMESNAGVNLFKTISFRKNLNFSLKIKINEKFYVPIEMIGNTSKMGMPGETTYLDLTIGEDADGDGLPDAWERNIASLYGKNINQINPNDDSDGDGLSNIQEYISGSYAFDKNDGVLINITNITDKHVNFEFLVITGRTYSIEASNNLNEWKKVKFHYSPENLDEELNDYFISNKVQNIKIAVPRDSLPFSSSESYFFKLRVK